MNLVLFIAAGGAIGAVGRYAVMTAVSHLLGAGYPYGTIMVNLIGSFVLGGLVESLKYFSAISNEMHVFLIVGVLGSFTTFSTFSMDVVVLMQRNEMFAAGLYILGSIVVSIGGLFLAMILFRQLFQ
jgi:CrcB protein